MYRSFSRSLFAALLFIGAAANADATTFDTSSPGVLFSVNDVNYYVRSSQIPPGSSIPGLDASSYISGSTFDLSATGPAYSDAGIVLYFNGGLPLGSLQNVSVASTGDPLSINLWFDTGGDGQFFAFASDGSLTGLNGDSYGGTGGSALSAASSLYMFAGDGAGESYTVAQLQAGVVTGIDSHTPIALWIGITEPNSAQISGVTVDALPEPDSLLLIGAGLIALALLAKRLG
jgi:hypothetical protein